LIVILDHTGLLLNAVVFVVLLLGITVTWYNNESVL